MRRILTAALFALVLAGLSVAAVWHVADRTEARDPRCLEGLCR